MARVLIVGCGCRGQELARKLAADGYPVRGTTRDPRNCPFIEAAGAEPVCADPNRLATLGDALEDVAVVIWLMASASGPEDEVAALHGDRLERLLERLVDTPVRGFVYDAAGVVDASSLENGKRLVSEASERWQLPVVTIGRDAVDSTWAAEARAVVRELIGEPA